VYEEVNLRVLDGVATIELNRPERKNAWTFTMAREVEAAMQCAEGDAEVGVIVLTGAGSGFCSGIDMNMLAKQSRREPAAQAPADAEKKPKKRRKMDLTYLMRLQKPVIAAINGACAGMAFPLALCCDIRFAANEAVFTTAFARRGLIAELGVASLLSRAVGSAHALDLLLSARRFDGVEAARIGLVNRSIPHAELADFVQGYAREMAVQCSPRSMSTIKQQVHESAEESLEEASARALDLMYESVEHVDFKEGVASMMEKRPPRFPRIGTKSGS
jgi:enoyl-CoA hydratase/carnithine racemase